mmetsp:Transcript_16324/g.39057  ORF Transcript_16324/g.39057 Transcript_16324/m.39057 type:complete len:402 (+) Transcript_16324:302-1507(+)
MAPFWKKGKRVDDDDDPLDTQTHHSIPNDLLPLRPPDDGDAPPSSGRGGFGGGMTKATSMLEMNVICDMVQFGEAMDALSPAVDTRGKDDDDDESGGFFIETSEHSCDDGFLSSSPDCVVDFPAVPPPPLASDGGMSRAMSQVTLTSTKLLQSNIRTISEEPVTTDHAEGLAKNGSSRDGHRAGEQYQVKLNDSCPPSLNCSNHSDSTPDNTTLRRRQPSRKSSGTRLRSSLKGSSNNLSSSLKSTDSIGSSTVGSNGLNGSMKRNVSFSSLEVRHYNVTLGDAPTTNGPAVSLDWEYDPSATTEFDLEEYEMYRTDEAPRRNRNEMIMPSSHRQYLLMREAGFTRGQLKVAMDEAKRAAKRREKTIKLDKYGLQTVDEALEKTRRKLGKMKMSSFKGKKY